MTQSDLQELRQRSLRVGLHWICLWFFLFYFNSYLWSIILKVVPRDFRDQVAILNSLTQPFFLTVELTSFAAFLLVLPHLAYEIAKFVLPGLYNRERKVLFFVFWGLGVTIFLGQLFSAFVVSPLVLDLFLSFNASITQTFIDLSALITFVLHLQLTFLFISFLPWILYLLIWFKVLSRIQIIQSRPYAYIFIFTLGMLLTPPDVISQCLVAIPLIILYEFILLSAYYIQSPNQD